MFKIHLAKYDPDRSGGGWTWQRNFANASQLYPYKEADVFLIAGASMLDKEEVRQAKADGKKIVLRADNMPRPSRNRRWVDEAGKTKFQYFAELSDLIIYQSQWSRNFLLPHLRKDGPVILNGVDTTVFNPNNRMAEEATYLYVRSSRDEGKQWILAWYWYVYRNSEVNRHVPFLEIVGKFSDDNLEYNFDFVNGERFRFLGVQENMSDIYKRNKYFLYTYSNDACSNTLIEARACGCEIVDVYGMLKTGGAPEIMKLEDLSSERMVKQYMEAING